MIGAQSFRSNVYPLLRMSKRASVGFEVVHDGIVYDIVIRPTTKTPKLNRAPRPKKQGIDKRVIKVDDCIQCGNITVAGLCLNDECINSQLVK